MTTPLEINVQGPQKPALWANDVRRLLDTDPCPCGAQKPFQDCHRPPPKEGSTPANTLHLLFTAVLIPSDGCEGCGSPTGRLVVPHGVRSTLPNQNPCRVCGLCRCEDCLPLQKNWAVQTARMDGEVPPETIVRNIRGRLASPPVQSSVQKLQFHTGAPVLPKDVIVIDSLTALGDKP